jgi:hypothetical protein
MTVFFVSFFVTCGEPSRPGKEKPGRSKKRRARSSIMAESVERLIKHVNKI